MQTMMSYLIPASLLLLAEGRGPAKSEVFQVVKYGPGNCVSTYPSDKGTCILKTECSKGQLDDWKAGLVCTDAQSENVRHVFGAGSFEHKETFDTLIPCTQCLALDNFDSGKDTEEAILKDEVEMLKHGFNKLNARVVTLEEAAAKGGEKATEALEEAADTKAFLSAHHHHRQLQHEHKKKHEHRKTHEHKRKHRVPSKKEQREEQEEDDKIDPDHL